MHESDTYYEEILYPLQNGVLSTLAASKAPLVRQIRPASAVPRMHG